MKNDGSTELGHCSTAISPPDLGRERFIGWRNMRQVQRSIANVAARIKIPDTKKSLRKYPACSLKYGAQKADVIQHSSKQKTHGKRATAQDLPFDLYRGFLH